MAIDYHGNPGVTLSAADREHFALLNDTLQQLYEAHGRTHLSAADRATFAPFFWHYLHEPCKALAIPVDCATKYILWFFKFSTQGGRYMGSPFGIIHTFGFRALAQKLYMDRTVLIPRLIPDRSSQKIMVRKLLAIWFLYFDRIDGIDGSTSVVGGTSGWKERQTCSFTLNERGYADQARKKDATELAQRMILLAPSHWASDIKSRTNNVLRRLGRAEQDVKSSDSIGTWKGPQPVPSGTPFFSHLFMRPPGWGLLKSMHLPDFFEHRPQKNGCDA